MRSSRIAWIAVPLALATAAGWWLTQERKTAVSNQAPAEVLEPAGSTTKDPRSNSILQLARDKGRGTQEIIRLYGEWANDESAMGARKLALSVLLSESSLPLKLKNVLEAIEVDQTPAEDDRLWPFITNSLAEVWTPDNIDKGRDLMLMENRPRAQQALIQSFIHYIELHRVEQLQSAQQSQLASDLVDVYANAAPGQKPDLLAALRTLMGNDVADILSGRALEPGFKLEAEIEHEKLVAKASLALSAHDRATDTEGEAEGEKPLPAELLDDTVEAEGNGY